jgi:hypothetical protein
MPYEQVSVYWCSLRYLISMLSLLALFALPALSPHALSSLSLHPPHKVLTTVAPRPISLLFRWPPADPAAAAPAGGALFGAPAPPAPGGLFGGTPAAADPLAGECTALLFLCANVLLLFLCANVLLLVLCVNVLLLFLCA